MFIFGQSDRTHTHTQLACFHAFKKGLGTSLVVQWLRLYFSASTAGGAVGELRSRVPRGTAKNLKKIFFKGFIEM